MIKNPKLPGKINTSHEAYKLEGLFPNLQGFSASEKAVRPKSTNWRMFPLFLKTDNLIVSDALNGRFAVRILSQGDWSIAWKEEKNLIYIFGDRRIDLIMKVNQRDVKR